VERQADEEALEGVCAAGGKVGAEAVAADVLHALLVGQRGDGGGGKVAGELLVEEDEVGEASADGGGGALEGGEGGLSLLASGGILEVMRIHTLVVIRYDTNASLVPSFSLMGVPTVHSSLSLPNEGASASRPVPGPFISCPGCSAGGIVLEV
jgi:hypothetical protein